VNFEPLPERQSSHGVCWVLMAVIGANSSRIGFRGEGRNGLGSANWSALVNITSTLTPWGRDMYESSPFESIALEQLMDRFLRRERVTFLVGVVLTESAMN